jgi:hypothetical protein
MRWQRLATSASPSCPDAELEQARRAALESGDEVVQQLTIAKYALTVGDTARAMTAIDSALEVSRHSLTELLGTVRRPGMMGFAGALVRSMAAASNATSAAPNQRTGDRKTLAEPRKAGR